MRRIYTLPPRVFLTLIIALAVIFVPLSHSAGMNMAIADSSHGENTHQTQHAHAHADVQEHDCDHDDAQANDQPASDPCGLCKLHPICHAAMLLAPSIELPTPSTHVIPATASLSAVIRTTKPPIAPPRA